MNKTFIDQHALEQRIAHAWATQPGARAEFRNNEAAHAAFMRAEAHGLTRVRDGQARAAQAVAHYRAKTTMPPAAARVAASADVALASRPIQSATDAAERDRIRAARLKSPEAMRRGVAADLAAARGAR
jgi:hypothetical protein